jgi:hypothetical protein
MEKLYVLYGSQMGNSDGAAEEFCNSIKSTYNDEFFNRHKLPSFEVETTCIQLDDFLEVKHANYTKCLVIFVSSYGVGQGEKGMVKLPISSCLLMLNMQQHDDASITELVLSTFSSS